MKNPVLIYIAHKNTEYTKNNKSFNFGDLKDYPIKTKTNLIFKLLSFFIKSLNYTPIFYKGEKCGYIKNFIESKNIICAQAYLNDSGFDALNDMNAYNKAGSSSELKTTLLEIGDTDDNNTVKNIKGIHINVKPKSNSEMIRGCGSTLRIRYRK